MNDNEPIIAPAVLGWSNPDTGPWSTRLYGKDDGPSPRWAKPHARVVEQSLELLTGPGREGDRYLVVRVGDRFVSDERLEALAAAIAELVAATPPVGGGQQ